MGPRQDRAGPRGAEPGADGAVVGGNLRLGGLPGLLQNRGSVRLGAVLPRDAEAKSVRFLEFQK